MYDVKKGFEVAKEIFAQYGVDVEKAMAICDSIPPVSYTHLVGNPPAGGFYR